MVPKKPTAVGVSFRLTEEARRLLEELARKNGVNMTAFLEMWIRKEAKEQDIK